MIDGVDSDMGKPDLSMTMNGALAGLVAITAPVVRLSIPWAAIGQLGELVATSSSVVIGVSGCWIKSE